MVDNAEFQKALQILFEACFDRRYGLFLLRQRVASLHPVPEMQVRDKKRILTMSFLRLRASNFVSKVQGDYLF